MIENIHIGEKIVVLFLALDEGALDFFDVGETCGFLDGVEGFVNNLHVPLIVINEFNFLFIIYNKFSESLLQDGGSIVL